MLYLQHLFQTLTLAVLEEDTGLLSEDIVAEMMARVCQQALERIDRTRKVAGTTFTALLYRYVKPGAVCVCIFLPPFCYSFRSSNSIT